MSLFVAVLLVSAQAAADAQLTAPAAASSPADPKKKEKKICKADPASSGSRMAKRICLTEQEWAQHGNNVTDSARAGFSAAPQDH
jgi:hypothetical protein